MEHSYKKAAAAVIALALIAAVVVGIVLASPTSPTAVPSGEASSSVTTTNAAIGDTGVGEATHIANDDTEAVIERWSSKIDGTPTVQFIDSAPTLETFLESGGENKIGVLTRDISYSIEQQSRLGTDDFKGILDGNGYKLTLMVYFRAGNDLVEDAKKTAHIDTAKEGIKSEIEVTGGNYTNGVGINGIDAIGLLTGVNRGTIANVTIDYSSNMALNDNPDQGWDNMLKSKENPAYMTAFGIVAGANFGDIDNVRINLVDAEYRTSDGTTLNFQGKFVGRQRDSHANASGRDSRSIENTAMVGTLAGVHINGAITNTYVDFASEAAEVSALADGWTPGSNDYSGINPKDGWRNAIAIAGGMVGFFIGDGGSLTNSYLAGGGKVRAYVLNARCLNDAADRDRHAGKGFNAFSGGITGGKFKFDDGMYSNNDSTTSMIKSQDGLGDLYNQIRGIVSSWTGEKWDNNNSDHQEAIDVYEGYYEHYWPPVAHKEFAVLIDTANLQSTPQIAYTFRYDDLYNNVPPDSNYFNLKPGIDNSGYAREWYEFYSVGGDGDDTVEVTIKDDAFRLEVATKDYLEQQKTEFSFGDQAQSDFGTDTGYSGTFVWSYDSSAVRPGEDDKPTNEIAMDDFLGAFARSYTFGTPPLSYQVTFGTQLQYDVAYTDGRTRKLYDGKPLDVPTLSLNDRGTPVTANSKAYEWQYLNAAGAEVVYEDTKFPLANNGSYTLRPSKDRTESIEEVETITGTYAYYDAGNRQVARIGQGEDAQVSVTQALLDITVTQTSDGADYTDGAWSNGVKFNVKLSDANDYASTGQAAPTAGSGIFNSYSYRAAGSNSGAMLETANTAFSFESKESTGANGRTYTAFTAYATNSMGQQVAVAGAGTVSRTVKIDTAAPVMQSINYYAYKGADTINGSNVHKYYFDIREELRNNKLDPDKYEDITETIGASADGNDVWTRYPVIIIAIATDNNLSGFDSANGVTISDSAGSIIQRQINQGTGKDTVSTSTGSLEIEQDRYLPKGASAVVGYVSSSNAVEVSLTDNAGNVTDITDVDDKGFVVGKLNVDTVELKLNSIDESSYYVVPGWQDLWTTPLKLEIDANVGSSGAEIQYLLIDKDEMERLGATASEVVPEGYKDAWTTLGAYSDDIPAIEERFREGAALFVRLVSSKGLYEPTAPLRLFVETTVSDPKLENGLYPYLYVDLITVTLNLGEDVIIVTKGDTTKSLAQWRVDGQLSEIFSKQYDGTSAYDPHHATKEAAVNARKFSIDWNKVEDGDVTGSGITLEALKTALDGKLYPYGSFYDASGNLAVDVKDGATTMKWEFVVDDSVAENYKYRLTFASEETGEIAATINLRDYAIGVEGIVKGDPDFDKMIVTNEKGEKTNELKVSYWGKKEDKYPFPFDFHYSTGLGDVIYFRYALVGGENGVFNAGGNYKIAVDAVKIVPEVPEGTETPEDAGWVEFELDENGRGDLPEYDNYNFHFTTEMKVTVEALSVNITSKLFKVEKNEEGGENLVEQEFSLTSLPYNGLEYRVKATYRTVEGETVDAEVHVSGDDGTIIQGVGAYTVKFATGNSNYTIRNTKEVTITIVGTNANLNLAAQTYAYNNGKPVNFEVKLADDSPFELPKGDVIEILYISGVDGDKAGNVKQYKVTMKWVEGVVTLSGDAPTEIGTYTVQMSYNGARTSEGTYQNNYTDVVLDSKMTIAKATPKILGVTDIAITYDKISHTYVVPDDPENAEDGLKMVNDYLDGIDDAEDVLVLQYLVEDGDPNDEDDWQNVDMTAAQSAGWFKNAGAYTFRYRYGGDRHYNAVTSDLVTLTINKDVYDGADLKLYKDNTNTLLTLDQSVFKVDYNGKSQYLTAKSETFFDYSGVAIEPGAEITYYREGNILSTTRPEALNMQEARDYKVTITITSDNYETFTYEMHYVINAVDIPDGAIVVKTSSGSDITDGTSADAPQSLIATYNGKEHGYVVDEAGNQTGEIIIEFDATKLLEYPGTTPKYSVTYVPDGNQSNTLINAGSYSGHYSITVGLTNYKPITVYVSMRINPMSTKATIEKDETIKPTTETNIYNVVSGMFVDVDGNEQEGTLVFTDSTGKTVTPSEQGTLEAGDYTVTMVDSNGNYLWGNVSVPITIAEPDASHVHTDVNGNGVCDSCGKDVPGIHVHTDANGDGICDYCEQPIGGEQPQPHDHVDANGDGKCDICGVEMNNQGGNDPVIDPNEGGNTAAIVGGVLIGVAGLVVIGTIVGVILIVRKKRKNVI